MKPKNMEGELPSSVKGKSKRNSRSENLSTMSVSDFIKSSLDSDDSDDQSKDNNEDLSEESVPKVRGNSAELEDSAESEEESEDEEKDANGDSSEEQEDSGEESDTSNIYDSGAHKKSLEKLRETDPEFFKYLEENDKKLLQFNVSDSEEEDDDDDDEEQVHKPNEDLEVASDESDFEMEGVTADERVVTLKMVQSAQEQLQNSNSLEVLWKAVQLFHSALKRVAAPKAAAAEEDENAGDTEYIVQGGSVFNAVVEMCMLDFRPALLRFLNLPVGKINIPINKCKKWNKVGGLLKLYLGDLLKFLASVSSPQILAVLLKHLHQLTVFVPYFPKLKRPFLKKLMSIWGSGQETVRVIAFLCILRITTSQQKELLEKVLKMMYRTYVNNSKFVSPSTLPSIQFMRRSLAEMFALDEAASYQYVFLYVRQLAIHLRNAITLHTKEAFQSVYNWQFVQSLHLWTEVLGATAHKPHLQPLLYPLVQVIIGTFKLIPTVQYYPLRFHCVQMLIHLTKRTGSFIPVLPFLLEVLTGYNFNKPNKKVSMKPMDFTCILRLSKLQLHENAFKDAVIEKIYQQMLEYLAYESHTVSFPDMVVPAVIQLKKFVKECKFPNYSRKMKQLLDKIEENTKALEIERNKVSCVLTDDETIEAWQTFMRTKGTPLMSFYESWNKLNMIQMAKRVTENDKLGEYNLPTIKKIVKKSADEGPVKLLPSDESEDEEEVGGQLSSPPAKRKRGVGGGKGKGRGKGKVKVQKSSLDSKDNVPEAEDIVQDMRLSDLE